MPRPSETRRARWSELLTPAGVAELERAELHTPPRHGGGDGREEPVLYLRGSLPARPAVAVVGTREPTREAVEFTGELVAGLCSAGMCIVSGGALGIDAAAHGEALRRGVPTVAVMGCGLDVVYPPAHAALYQQVTAAGGCLLSLWPDGVQPMRHRFLLRNRLLAALCVALVVVQAPVRSGARSAAAAARRLGRVVCAVPHAPWDERGAGCAGELLLGAYPVVQAKDLLRAIGGPMGARLGTEVVPPQEPESEPAPSSPEPSFEPDELRVIKALDLSPRHQDELCERAGLPYGRLAATLMTLTLRSVVVEGPAAYYRLAKALPNLT